MTRLTVKRLEAIVEALDFRIAGEIGEEACPQEDYENARDWASDELCKREQIIADHDAQRRAKRLGW